MCFMFKTTEGASLKLQLQIHAVHTSVVSTISPGSNKCCNENMERTKQRWSQLNENPLVQLSCVVITLLSWFRLTLYNNYIKLSLRTCVMCWLFNLFGSYQYLFSTQLFVIYFSVRRNFLFYLNFALPLLWFHFCRMWSN